MAGRRQHTSDHTTPSGSLRENCGGPLRSAPIRQIQRNDQQPARTAKNNGSHGNGSPPATPPRRRRRQRPPLSPLITTWGSETREATCRPPVIDLGTTQRLGLSDARPAPSSRSAGSPRRPALRPRNASAAARRRDRLSAGRRLGATLFQQRRRSRIRNTVPVARRSCAAIRPRSSRHRAARAGGRAQPP